MVKTSSTAASDALRIVWAATSAKTRARRARGGTKFHRGDLLHTRAEVVVAMDPVRPGAERGTLFYPNEVRPERGADKSFLGFRSAAQAHPWHSELPRAPPPAARSSSALPLALVTRWEIRNGVNAGGLKTVLLEAFTLGASEECAPRMARSTSVGALLLRAVGDRIPISDPASHAAIRRRELLEETRTLFASATVCSRGGKGLRGGCPPISALLEMSSSASRYSVLLL